MIHAILRLALAVISGGDAAPADRGWSGDVPRAALAALASGSIAEADQARFQLGLLASGDAWNRYAEAFAGSPWPEEPWQPNVDWQRQAVVYVAFDGATRLLAIRDWRTPRAGTGELIVGATLSRRREGPEGPCSVALRRVDRAGLETVRVLYTGRGGEELLGKLELRQR